MKIKRLVNIGDFFAWFNFGCLSGRRYKGATFETSFPCGLCPTCRKSKSNDWVCRLVEEDKHCKSSYFVTLTYDDWFCPHVQPYEYDVYNQNNDFLECSSATPFPWQMDIEVVRKKDVQLWLKRLRKRLDKLSIKMRYFIVAEYGGETFRPHYHGILFFDTVVDFPTLRHLVVDTWVDARSRHGLGFVDLQTVSTRAMRYVAKYATGITELPEHLQVKEYRPFMLSSRRGGIGHQYIQDTENVHFHRTTLNRHYSINGFDYSLPTYWYYKMFDKTERALMEVRRLPDKWKKFYEKLDKYEVISGEKYNDTVHIYYQSCIEDTRRKIKTKNKKTKI